MLPKVIDHDHVKPVAMLQPLSTVPACIALMRPANVVIAFASVVAGVFCAYGDAADPASILAGLSMALLCAAANAGNDCMDVEIDRRNKPHRPLPAGRIGVKAAVAFTVTLYVAGLGLGAAIGPLHFAIAAATVLLSVAYNILLNRRGAAGNLIVSAAASVAFLYGGLSGAKPWMALIPAGLAFLFHAGREVVKDLEDMAGDHIGRSRSIPIRYGAAGALTAITAVFAALIVATLIPYYFQWFGRSYLIVVAVVDLVLLYVLWALWSDSSARNAGRMSRLLKADMALGLLALFAGRL